MDSPLRQFDQVILGSHNASNTVEAVDARERPRNRPPPARSCRGSALTRTVFITGVLGGIGRATAEAFHDAGWRVTGSDRREPDADDPAPIDRFLQADIAEAGIGSKLEAFLADFDRLDAVVNNAAMQIEKPLIEMSDAEWELIMATNVRAAFIVSRTAYAPAGANLRARSSTSRRSTPTRRRPGWLRTRRARGHSLR